MPDTVGTVLRRLGILASRDRYWPTWQLIGKLRRSVAVNCPGTKCTPARGALGVGRAAVAAAIVGFGQIGAQSRASDRLQLLRLRERLERLAEHLLAERAGPRRRRASPAP